MLLNFLKCLSNTLQQKMSITISANYMKLICLVCVIVFVISKLYYRRIKIAIIYTCWVGYVVFLFGQLVVCREVMQYNMAILNPFETYVKAFLGDTSGIVEIVLNICLLIPFVCGFYCIYLRKSNNVLFWKIIPFISLLISLTIEIAQYYLKRGYFELSDIINNTLGAVIAVHFLYKHTIKKAKKTTYLRC